MNTTDKPTKTASAPETRTVVQLDRQGPYAWGVARDGKLIAQGMSKGAAEALAKRTIPAEKPKDRSTKAQWEELANESIADAGYWKSEARKAQAHAAKLAEALRDCMADLDHYVSTHGPGPDHRRDAAKQALAAYESEVRS